MITALSELHAYLKVPLPAPSHNNLPVIIPRFLRKQEKGQCYWSPCKKISMAPLPFELIWQRPLNWPNIIQIQTLSFDNAFQYFLATFHRSAGNWRGCMHGRTTPTGLGIVFPYGFQLAHDRLRYFFFQQWLWDFISNKRKVLRWCNKFQND